MKLVLFKKMNESYEHLIIYIDIVKNWLRNKNVSEAVQDYSKFELALSHDRPHFIKWDYSLEKPTVEYLESKFKLAPSEPRKILDLNIRFIYIYAKEIGNKIAKDISLTPDQTLAKLNDPIYFNIDGDIIDPSSIDI